MEKETIFLNVGESYKLLCDSCEVEYHTLKCTGGNERFLYFAVTEVCRCQPDLAGYALFRDGTTLQDLIPEISENDIEFYLK